MKRTQCLSVWMIALLLAACGPSDEELASLGRHQRIQVDAPVQAASSITIDAPASRVWSILANVADWPRWQREIDATSSVHALGENRRFTWRTGGMTIHSRVVLSEPDTALAWTGRTYLARALHVWKLTALGPTRTRVESSESMDGFLLSHFYSSAQLQATEDHWLASLKAAAESARPAEQAHR